MPEKSRSKRRTGLVVLVAFLCGFVVVALALTWMTLHKRAETRKQAQTAHKDQSQGPRVTVAQVQRSRASRRVELIGEARPFLSTPIYGRVSGFLREMRVDKGDEVRQGDILATIEAPETDKAYLSSLADWRNKDRIARREKKLLRQKLISQQEADQAIYTADIAEATLGVQRVLKDYEIVRAPFDGTITARYADPGALIQNATNGQSAAQVLLNISTIARLRVYVYADQSDAPFIRPGVQAHISLPGETNVDVSAPVARTARELDPRTRTLLTEVDLDNSDGRIVPGSFVSVSLEIPTRSYLEIPVKSLVMRGQKAYVPVVSADSTIHYREVTPGENTGQTLRISAGLREGERVAVDVGQSLADGQKIQPTPLDQTAQKQMAGKAEKAASGS